MRYVWENSICVCVVLCAMQQLELEKFEVCKNEKSKLMSLTLEWPAVEGGSTIKQVHNIQLYTLCSCTHLYGLTSDCVYKHRS